ncbi:NELL2-interacting cell ontogeny regulator 1 isoform X2 [Scleropages formosus]|uniref:NELL2-interacting cell ontogeny regulator 1 isoform X2 n=1 Tax=Scleropages formosus TaxID=113540 RepID=UPI0008780CA2|nr:neuropeptide-like protein C4orf48 homolog isoform X2 [Scleropages formosus]
MMWPGAFNLFSRSARNPALPPMLLMLLMLLVQLLCVRSAEATQEPGTVIPAESRPCVDCHAFEFMQRALQDLKKTAFNLDSRAWR